MFTIYSNQSCNFLLTKSILMRFLLKFIGFLLAFFVGILLIGSIVFYKKDIPIEILKAKYANADSKFMNLMGMQVHYKEEGNPNDSIPLVLIHGTSSSLFTWDSSAAILKKQHRIIRFDLPAFALTGPSPERDYGFIYYSRFVDSFLNRLHITKCYMAGNSLGGGIAWHYTVSHPEKISKLILVDASGYTTGIKTKGSLALTLVQIPVIKNVLKWITPRSIVKKSVEDVYGDKSKVSPQLVDLYYDMALRAGNRQALIDRMQNGFKMESGLIKQIQTPTLLIWGDKDPLIPVECAALFKKDLRNSEATIFKGVGHVPMEEEPKLFAERVLLFLQ